MRAMVPEAVGLGLLDGGAEATQARRQLLERARDLVVHGQPRDGGQDRHAEVGQPVAAGRRQLHAPGHVLARVGAREDGERQLQILGAAGDRALHAHDAHGVRQGRQGELPALGQEGLARPVAVDAAEDGGHPDGAADVAADLEGAQPGGDRGRAAPARPARGAAEVPRVVRPPVDGVGGLPVGEHGRDVGLAQQHGAGRAGAHDGGGVVLGDEVAPLRHAARGGQAGHVERLLDRHGEAAKGAAPAARGSLVGVAGLLAGPLEIADHHRVEAPVVTLDPADVELGELGGRHPPGAQGSQELGGAREGIHVSHGISTREESAWRGWSSLHV